MDEYLVRDVAFDSKSPEALLAIIRTGYPPNRARAVAALARLSAGNVPLLEKVAHEILSPDILRFKLMGTITVAQVGLAALLVSSDPQVRERALLIMDEWPAPQREDLNWYLKSQKINVRR